MNERIKGLYQKHILAKSKEVQLVGKLADYTHALEAYNPMCGDQYTVYLRLLEDRVEDARFEGYGCAISKASTAVLAELVIGKTLVEIGPLITSFLELIDEDSLNEPEAITTNEQLLAFAAARDFPERKACASLSWERVNEYLNEVNGTDGA